MSSTHTAAAVRWPSPGLASIVSLPGVKIPHRPNPSSGLDKMIIYMCEYDSRAEVQRRREKRTVTPSPRQEDSSDILPSGPLNPLYPALYSSISR